MHDLGHPPFGHNGEKALDDLMKEFGGFEGNAQSLRIVSRLEKRQRSGSSSDEIIAIQGQDTRLGLNLTYRALASILKYDNEIPHRRTPDEKLIKGYYADQRDLVSKIKDAVAPRRTEHDYFKTIECSIMDIADDIAYSTYDLEDSLKAGFLTPADILSSDEELLRRVAIKVSKETEQEVSAGDVLSTFWDIFSGIAEDPENLPDSPAAGEEQQISDLFVSVRAFKGSREFQESGYVRSGLTSQLVGEFISAVNVECNANSPSLSRAELNPEARQRVEILKNYTFEATIFSTRLKVAEFRGYEVVNRIFEALTSARGHLLMPDDVRSLYRSAEANASAWHRVVSDFVAGMTDRYALEFYARLHSDNPQSIFKPI